MLMGKHMQPWKTKFITLWTGQAVSMLTSSVLQMAIIWYITAKTQSAAILSIVTLIAFLPQAILGSFIGVYIDRYNRKKIMIVADLFIAVISLALVAAGFIGDISIELILVVAGLRSVGTAFHYPALQATTPLIVPKNQLTKYAGYAQSFESVSNIAGPGIAALLFAVFPLSTIALFDVFGALFAVLMLTFVKLPPKTVKQPYQKAHMLQEVKQGLSVIKREPGMIPLMVIGALYAIIYFPIGTYYPLITMTYFGGSIAASSVVETVFSCGMLGGSLLLGLLGGKLLKRHALIGSLFLYGIGVLVTGLLPRSGLSVFVLLSAMMGISVPFYFGVETAIFQTNIKEAYLGRVLSLSSSISMVAMPLGLVISGLFAEWLGVEKWFLILGALTLLLAFVGIKIPSLKSWDKPEEANKADEIKSDMDQMVK